MSRLDALADKLEAGEHLTADDLSRVLALQAIDIAREGERFLSDILDAELEADEQLKQIFSDVGTAGGN